MKHAEPEWKYEDVIIHKKEMYIKIIEANEKLKDSIPKAQLKEIHHFLTGADNTDWKYALHMIEELLSSQGEK